MGKDKLIDAIIIDKKNSKYFFDFFQNSNDLKFRFNDLDNIDLSKINSFLIVFPSSVNEEILLEAEKKFEIFNNTKIVFFMPSILKNLVNKKSYNKIYYPINIENFKKEIKFYLVENNFSFNHLTLNNKNILTNTNDQKTIYLTETESSILKLFFKKNNLSKDEIKVDVLKIKPSIDSKSLETHLYRLRKKLTLICKSTIIESIDKKNLNIKISA